MKTKTTEPTAMRTIWINATDADGTLLHRLEVEVPADCNRLTICRGEPCLHNELDSLDIGTGK